VDFFERVRRSRRSRDVRLQSHFGGFSGVANSVLSGEDIARIKFTNKGQTVGYVGVTPNQPLAIIVPVPLDEYGGSVNAKRGAYIAGPESISARVKILPARSCLACCCGGLPPLIQSVSGSGTGYLAAGGTVVKKTLVPGEKIVVDTDSVVAFTNGVGYDVQRVGTFVTCCCGGEGCFNTVLTGPGEVFIQSMSKEKLMAFLGAGPGQGNPNNGAADGGAGGAPPSADVLHRQ